MTGVNGVVTLMLIGGLGGWAGVEPGPSSRRPAAPRPSPAQAPPAQVPPRVRTQVPVRPRPDAVRPPDVAPAPTTAEDSAASHPVTILPDGTIEERLANGARKQSTPGNCGWKTISPDGRVQTVQCATNVQKLDLPVPSGATADWLSAHAESLLGIARVLLGTNAATIDNHVSANEASATTVYDKIRLRTALVNTLSLAVRPQ